MNFERHIGSLWVRIVAALLLPVALLSVLLHRRALTTTLGLLALLFILHSAAPLYTAWMAGARRLGGLVTTLLFGAIYLIVVPPFSLIIWGLDPLRLRRRGADSYWINRRQGETDLASLQRMG